MNELIKDLLNIIILFCLVWIGFYLYTRHDTLEQRMIRYDCNLTEFVPNVPNDVVNECRRRKLETFKPPQKD